MRAISAICRRTYGRCVSATPLRGPAADSALAGIGGGELHRAGSATRNELVADQGPLLTMSPPDPLCATRSRFLILHSTLRGNPGVTYSMATPRPASDNRSRKAESWAGFAELYALPLRPRFGHTRAKMRQGPEQAYQALKCG